MAGSEPAPPLLDWSHEVLVAEGRHGEVQQQGPGGFRGTRRLGRLVDEVSEVRSVVYVCFRKYYEIISRMMYVNVFLREK